MSRHPVVRWWRSSRATTALLFAGVIAVAVYGIGDVVSGLLYAGYSWRDQAISELSAFGSPVRPLMATMIVAHGLLLMAFGVGVWRGAERRSLRWLGGLLVAIGAVGLPTHTVFPMTSRGMETGFNDTMHIALTMAFSLLVMAALIIVAVAYRGWLRFYSIATLAILMGAGMAASFAMGGLEENVTPWVGALERVNAYAYFAWLIALAVTFLRRGGSDKRVSVPLCKCVA
jgi:hypothetical membrane protein